MMDMEQKTVKATNAGPGDVDIHDRVMEAYYGKLGPAFMRDTQSRVNWVCSKVEGNNVLDVGCSQGIVPILLAREGTNVVGLDSDPESIAEAREYVAAEPEHVGGNISFVNNDFLLQDFTGSNFTTVVMAEVLEHLVRPERFVEQAANLLQAGGRLVVTVPFGINDYIDHKHTFYLLEPLSIILPHFDIVEIKLLGKWLGIVAARRAPGGELVAMPTKDQLVALEGAFLAMERDLRDKLSRSQADLSTFKKRVTDADSKLRTASEEAKRLQRQQQETEQQLAALQAARDALQADLARTLEELAMARKEGTRDRQVVGELQAKVDALTAQTGGLGRDLAAAQEQLRTRNEQAQALEAEVARLAGQRTGLDSELATVRSEADSYRGQMQELAATLTSVHAKSASLEEALEQSRNDAQRYRDDIAGLERDIGNLSERSEGLEADLDAAAGARAQMQGEIDRLVLASQTLEADLRAAVQARDDLQAERDRLSTKLVTLEQEVQTARAACNRLQQEVTTYQVEAKKRHTASPPVTVGSVKNLARTIDQLERANRSLQATVAKLERADTVKTVRLQSLEKRADVALKQANNVRETLSFRLGFALLHGFKSWNGFINLPKALIELRRDASTRRQARGNLAAPANPAVNAVVAPAAKAQEAAAEVQLQPLPKRTTAKRPLQELLADLKNLRVGAVMDEFTFHSFQPECDLHQLRPACWEEDLDNLNPDLVFIESAWRGTQDLWALKVSNPTPEIMGVIEWCTRNNVPTVFWNKEDPVHFGGFLHIARAVDYVFTTDVDCIARYKQEVGHENVYLLPFAAQPAVHNPIEVYERKDAFNFAGSYYLKYPERQRDFKNIIEVAKQLKSVDIYDRNYHKPHPHYTFPDEYTPFILGNLPFSEIDKAYKGYRYGINMNTIKQSQTMFARRVFELLASNTVVISNFSRGVRVMFGDLVVASDAESELKRQMEPICANDLVYRKFRLAGLRKVMSQHTYYHRLSYILGKVTGQPVTHGSAQVWMVAFPADAAQAQQVVETFERQTYANKTLCLIGTGFGHLARKDSIHAMAEISHLRKICPPDAYVAALSAQDYYGANYVTDLVLGLRYSDAVAVGKGCWFDFRDGLPSLTNNGRQYHRNVTLPARAAIARADVFFGMQIDSADMLENAMFSVENSLSTDEFNYLRNGGPYPSALASSVVDDLGSLKTGVEWDSYLGKVAPQIAPSDGNAGPVGDDVPAYSAAQIKRLLNQPGNKGIVVSLDEKGLQIRADLDPTKHEYIYASRPLPRKDLNLELNSRVQIDADAKGDMRLVFEFQDSAGKKISHAMVGAGSAISMAIPNHCTQVRLGMRVQGIVEATIRRIVLADIRENPELLVTQSRTLVVTKQYPAYDDLYRYGFLHSRVRAYAEAGQEVDVFKLHNAPHSEFREFEGINVVAGDHAVLDKMLSKGQFSSVLIHLLDRKMWETVSKHLDKVKVIVWSHGADILTWERRPFEAPRLETMEIERQKKLSQQRVAFWRGLFSAPHPNVSFVFVSQYLAEAAFADVGVRLSEDKYSVIHNYVSTELFAYKRKRAADRTRILSIRPYAGLTYANDLTVKAIQLLSERPYFSQLQFHLVGDGDLFEETTAPLRNYPNVKLEKRFLAQAEIARLHGENGIFLVPSRADTQGVSRDEAMSSGLVAVTNNVAAIPEFVDAECAILAEQDDHVGLANGIEQLFLDPDLFLRMSAKAAARVRMQSSKANTIDRELAIIERNEERSEESSEPDRQPAQAVAQK